MAETYVVNNWNDVGYVTADTISVELFTNKPTSTFSTLWSNPTHDITDDINSWKKSFQELAYQHKTITYSGGTSAEMYNALTNSVVPVIAQKTNSEGYAKPISKQEPGHDFSDFLFPDV